MVPIVPSYRFIAQVLIIVSLLLLNTAEAEPEGEARPYTRTTTGFSYAIVHDMCKKYNHCKSTTYDRAHWDSLKKYITKQLISERSRIGTTKMSGPKPPHYYNFLRMSRAEDSKLKSLSDFEPQRAMLFAICRKYKHCNTSYADTLHCYQLESHLLKLKEENEGLLQSADTKHERNLKQDLDGINADLNQLTNFGSHRPSNLDHPPDLHLWLKPR